MNKNFPCVAVVLDGLGIGKKYEGNAVALAKKPFCDEMKKSFPYCELAAHGLQVGLEKDKVSGSEVGHINIGYGRIVEQEDRKITNEIKNGEFFENKALLEGMKHVKKNNSNLHLIGLLSKNGSPHSNYKHFRALIKLAKKHGIQKLFVHFFTDGRDSSPKSARRILEKWSRPFEEFDLGEIATIGGRFYGMDRTKHWNRLKKAYDAIVNAKGKKANSPCQAIEKAYKAGLSDEFILPTVIYKNNHPVAKIKDNDAAIFFHLRSDRARQLTKLFVLDSSDETELPRPRLKNFLFVTLTGFGPRIQVKTAYNNTKTDITLVNSLRNFSQLYISETEKFAHVTYFLNGQYPKARFGEERIRIPSPKVQHYDKKPKMSAPVILKTVLDFLKEQRYDFIFINFPNPDMLGHTGNIKAAIKGIEFLDKCLKKLWKEIDKQNGTLLIFSDHGNAEMMLNAKTGEPVTSHTRNPVPFSLINKDFKKLKLAQGGRLSNVTPTILDVLDVEKNPIMDESLIV
ncbi:MAG: 2,3-bisphosphoglycerate-independent phosphoglycerate mutase [Candidatus Moranbacteria bacterium]|nr:2,3-bisphosphoglycerate-independent phosphoglycerate mutase [Candidatus Moranbacteria bacterium]